MIEHAQFRIPAKPGPDDFVEFYRAMKRHTTLGWIHGSLLVIMLWMVLLISHLAWATRGVGDSSGAISLAAMAIPFLLLAVAWVYGLPRLGTWADQLRKQHSQWVLDPAAITLEAPSRPRRVEWSVFRKGLETDRLFVLLSSSMQNKHVYLSKDALTSDEGVRDLRRFLRDRLGTRASF